MADLFSSLFNGEGINVNTNEPVVENHTEFRPSYRKGQNDRYEALIRFVPNYEDPENLSIISKWTVFLKNPLTNTGKTIDSPSSVGEPDPLTQMFFSLRNSNLATAKNCADNFKRHQNFFSLVQVIEAPSEPSIVGKILVWKYGQKIYEKIKQEMTPLMQGTEPQKPFDLFKGRVFKVVAIKQENFNNLDSCFFAEVPYPNNCLRITVDNQGQPQTILATKELAQSEQGRKLISDYLVNNSPKLSDYQYKPWDAETKQYVDEMILLHGQILQGRAVSAPQQIASAQQVLSQPSVAGGMFPQTSSPVQDPVPVAPSLGSILSQPAQPIATAQPVTPAQPVIGGMFTGNPTPENPTGQSYAPTNSIVPPTPAQPAAPATPIPGLSMGLDSGAFSQSTPQMPGSGINGVDMSNIDAIMNMTPGTAPSTPSAGNTGGVGDISSILKDTII